MRKILVTIVKTRSKALARSHGSAMQHAAARTKKRNVSIKQTALKRIRGPCTPILALNDRRWWAEVSLSGIVVLDKKNANRRHTTRLWRAGAAGLLARLNVSRRCALPGARVLAESLGRSLQIPASYGPDRALPLQLEPTVLSHIGQDRYRRSIWLEASAGLALQNMLRAARQSSVPLEVISAFRSVHYQASLLARKRQRGETLASILRVSAAPGYSEHHSGRAIDLAEIGAPALTEEFADTACFAWLRQNAHRFGFVMSFPPDNPHGVLYEPWHWCYRPRDTARSTRRQRAKQGSQR